MMATPHVDLVVAFHRGGPDDCGRTLDDIVGWPDDWLETTHDFIQWMFPTRRPSGVNASAPLVTDETAAAFAAEPALRQTLERSLDRMLAFYGLTRSVSGDAVRVDIDPARFQARAANWLRPNNHNHLRLTRIMDSLASLGLTADARALQRCLLDDVARGRGAGKVTESTVRFWQSAV